MSGFDLLVEIGKIDQCFYAEAAATAPLPFARRHRRVLLLKIAAVLAALAVYGVLYAVYPRKFLERKGDREITPMMLRTARISGVIIVIVCAALMAATVIRGS